MIPKLGVYTHHISSKRPKEIECYSCRLKGQMSVDRYIKSVYLYYFPMFPFWGWQEISCVHCHAGLKFSEMGPELKEKYRPYRQIPIPMPWHFTGLIFILGAILWSQRSTALDQQTILDRAKNLKVKRVIEYQAAPHTYTSMKVCGFEEDYILMLPNQFTVEDKRDLEHILLSENYGPDTILFHKDSLQKLIAEEKVLGIYW